MSARRFLNDGTKTRYKKEPGMPLPADHATAEQYCLQIGDPLIAIFGRVW